MRARTAEFAIRLTALLPLRVSYALATIVGHIAYWFPNSLKRPLQINIDLCFKDLPAKQRARLRRISFVEMSRAVFETGALWLWHKTKVLSLVKNVSGEELLTAALAKGRGVILALPHLGAWEMMGLYCSTHYPMTSLYRPLRLAGLDPFIKDARQRLGATLVPTNASGIRALYKALANNELVAMLPDQDPGKEGSVFAPFCGVPASTMTLLPKLAQKTGAALVYGYAERLPRGKGYHIHFLPASDGSPPADIETAAAQINKDVENCIRQLPAQYQWAYKRFKSRPEGEPRIY